MNLRILSIAFLLLGLKVNAQQLTFMSQYMVDNYIMNPAAAGTYEYSPIALSARQQWIGLTDAPSTQSLTAHMNIKDHHGVGLKVYNDMLGPLSRISAQGTYAYHVEIDRDKKLSFGLSFVFNQQSLNGAEFNIESQNDQVLTSPNFKLSNFDADFGVQYNTDEFFVGLAVPQLFQNGFNFGDSYNVLSEQVRHYYFMGGYKIKVNREIKIEPSFMMKAVANAPVQFDLNARFHYDDKYWAGLSWRIQDAVSIMLGLNLESFAFGYAFDFTTNELRNYSSGTHEIYLAYKISKRNRPSFAR